MRFCPCRNHAKFLEEAADCVLEGKPRPSTVESGPNPKSAPSIPDLPAIDALTARPIISDGKFLLFYISLLECHRHSSWIHMVWLISRKPIGIFPDTDDLFLLFFVFHWSLESKREQISSALLCCPKCCLKSKANQLGEISCGMASQLHDCT